MKSHFNYGVGSMELRYHLQLFDYKECFIQETGNYYTWNIHGREKHNSYSSQIEAYNLAQRAYITVFFL